MEVAENLPRQFPIKIINDEVPSTLDSIINSIIKKEGYISFDVQKRAISTDGGNYLADLYEADIKGKTKEGIKEISIFIKNMKPGEEKFEVISIPRAYKTEIFGYRELLKIYDELQDEVNMPVDERFKSVKSFEECNPRVIVLENLSKKGYITPIRTDIVSLEFAEIAMKILARFHGLSFVLEKKRPDYFQAKIKPIRTAYVFGPHWDEFVDNMEKVFHEAIGDDLDKETKDKIHDIVSNYPKYYKGNANIRCLNHGDYRPNNIMVKEINGKIKRMIPVDYQLLHYGCPLLDFWYFIFISTNKEFRKNNLSLLKSTYYNELKKFLKYFEITIDTVLPRQEYEKAFEEKRIFGLMVALIYAPLVYVDENHFPNISEDDMQKWTFKVKGGFNDFIRDAINDFKDWSIL